MHDAFFDFLALDSPGGGPSAPLRFRVFRGGVKEGRTRRGGKSLRTALETVPLAVSHGPLPPGAAGPAGEAGALTIDTERLARILVPGTPSFDIKTLGRRLGLPEPDDPAERTASVYLALRERAASLDRRTTSLLVSLTRAADDRGLTWFFESLGDREPAGEGPGGPEAAAVDTCRGSGPGVPGEPGADIRVTPEDVTGVLGGGGLLAGSLEGFEERPEQIEMAFAVMNAVNEGKVLLAEAGTGTGKSYAYLVPLIFHASLNGARAVVSTNTKNLQEQLFEKDLPALERIMPYPFRYSLLKGRQNYLCRQRFNELVDSLGMFPGGEDAEELLPLAVWSRTTATGDVAENRAFDPRRAPVLWRKVQCDARTCPLRSGGTSRTCFLRRARERAQQSHIIVVNHALLLSDTAMEGGILGEYQNLVIDEAHNLEKVARDQLGRSIAAGDIHQLFERSFGRERDRRGKGRRRGEGTGRAGEIRRRENDLFRRAADCRKSVRRFFEAAGGIVEGAAGSGDRNDPYTRKLRYRAGDPVSAGLGREAESLVTSLAGLRADLAGLVGLMESEEGEAGSSEERASRRRGLEGALEELGEMIENLHFLVEADSEEWVYWAEIGGRGDRLALRACPVDVALLLRTLVFDRVRSVTISSATMSVGGDYSFTARTLGVDLLEPGRTVTYDGGTSFPLEDQVLLLLPTFLPSVLDPSFVERLPEFLFSVLRRVDGGTLVLFTSHDWLRRTYLPLRDLCSGEGITCMAQSEDGSREVLLDRFRGDERSVLLGTDRFWEGIDVPGEALELVVIVRLPFLVPSEPTLEAISEHMAARGEDPFGGYALPRTALRLKQGFGRLIRTRDDRGIVLVLDKRIVEKRYGASLRQSLPVRPRIVDREDHFFLLLERWQDGAPAGGGGTVRRIEFID